MEIRTHFSFCFSHNFVGFENNRWALALSYQFFREALNSPEIQCCAFLPTVFKPQKLGRSPPLFFTNKSIDYSLGHINLGISPLAGNILPPKHGVNHPSVPHYLFSKYVWGISLLCKLVI